jgi:predicted ribosome-associated RNA-binding protein Tma20
MKALKQGKVKKHFFGDGKMYQILPTEKGKDFEKIHNLKDELYRERNKR